MGGGGEEKSPPPPELSPAVSEPLLVRSATELGPHKQRTSLKKRDFHRLLGCVRGKPGIPSPFPLPSLPCSGAGLPLSSPCHSSVTAPDFCYTAPAPPACQDTPGSTYSCRVSAEFQSYNNSQERGSHSPFQGRFPPPLAGACLSNQDTLVWRKSLE